VAAAQRQQQWRGIQQCLHGPRANNLGLLMGQRSAVAAWDEIEMKRAFPGPRKLRIADAVAVRPGPEK